MNRNQLMLTAALGIALSCASYADTSWLIRSTASTSGRMQLFATRCGKPRPLLVGVDKPKSAKQFKSLRFGDRKNKFVFSGINERGVAVAFTSAGPTPDKPVKPGKGQRLWTGTYAVDQVLRNAKSAADGAAILRKAASKGLVAHSMIVLITDPKKAYIFEAAARHQANRDLGLSYAIYTHMWKYPGMEDASSRNPKDYYTCIQREWVAREGIRKARQGDRKVSILEAIAVSRLNTADIKREDITSAPSLSTSIDGYIFEVDAKYPGVLSCVYAALGPQRHTVYLPIPLGAIDELPQELIENNWSAAGEAAKQKTDPKTPVADELVELERCLMQEFNDKRYLAQKLLDEKKPAEAKKLLRDTLRRQLKETMGFMSKSGSPGN